KSQAIYTDMQLQAVQSDVQSQLLQSLQQAETLKQSMDEYAKALSLQNNETLLNKAFRAGNISLIEYFIELSTLYQSRQNYLQLQNQYQKAMADIYKYKL
ncbi:MAG: TolC family protein, partial [Tannerellaceae bacterium]